MVASQPVVSKPIETQVLNENILVVGPLLGGRYGDGSKPFYGTQKTKPSR